MEKWLKAASHLPSNLRKRVAKTATLILLNQLESLDVRKLGRCRKYFSRASWKNSHYFCEQRKQEYYS